MLFALLGGHVDGTVTHQYQAPRAEDAEVHDEKQQQQQPQQQEQGSRSRVPSETPHLLYPQLSTKSQPQSAASQDTPLQTPEQTQVVIPPDQQGIPELHVSQTASLQHEHGHPSGPEMFASAASSSMSNQTGNGGNRPVSESGAWMMPVMDSNNGRIVLPLAPPVPTSTPFDGFVSLPSMDFGDGTTNDLGMMGMSLSGDFACSAPAPAPAPPPAPAPTGPMTIMDNPPGLWEKLQAFYEPSVPLFWEGDVSCVGDVNPGMPMPMPAGGGMGGMGVGAMYGGGGGGMNGGGFEYQGTF